jgi:hypothetical protein
VAGLVAFATVRDLAAAPVIGNEMFAEMESVEDEGIVDPTSLQVLINPKETAPSPKRMIRM